MFSLIGRSENLDYWDNCIKSPSDTMDGRLDSLPLQYTVSKDWEERLTESKQKMEALKLENFNDCYLLPTLVTSFKNGLDYNDTSKDNEKKTKNIFLAMVRQSRKDEEENSLLQKGEFVQKMYKGNESYGNTGCGVFKRGVKK